MIQRSSQLRLGKYHEMDTSCGDTNIAKTETVSSPIDLPPAIDFVAEPSVPPPTAHQMMYDGNNDSGNSNQKNTTKKKKKPRYSKAKKRELQQLRQEKEEEEELLRKKKRKRPRPNKKNKDIASLDEVDRILRCADNCFHTGSVVVETKDETFGDDVVKNENNNNTSNDGNEKDDPATTATTTITTTTTSNNDENNTTDATSPSRLIVRIQSGSSISEPRHLLLPSPVENYKVFARRTTIKVQPLLVLDLNGILCFRDRKRRRRPPKLKTNASAATNRTTDPTSHWRMRQSIGTVAMTPVVPRSDLYGFLDYLDRHFCLAVWTSAKAKTAKKLLDLLLGDPRTPRNNRDYRPTSAIRKRFLFVWNQCQCTKTVSTAKTTTNGVENSEDHSNGDNKGENSSENSGDLNVDTEEGIKADTKGGHQADSKADNKKKNNDHRNDDDDNSYDDDAIVFEKHLPKIWKAFPLWSANNTLLIDDSPEKCPLGIANAVHPPPLHGKRPPLGWLESDQYMNHNNNNKSNGGFDLTDEENENQQGIFFRKLVGFWTEQPHSSLPWTTTADGTRRDDPREVSDDQSPATNGTAEAEATITTRNNTRYYDFLEQHATGHMGWRQPAAQQHDADRGSSSAL